MVCAAKQAAGKHGACGRLRLRSDQAIDAVMQRLGGGNAKQALGSRIKEGQIPVEIVRERGIADVAQNLQKGAADILHGVLEAPILARDAIQRRGIPPDKEG